MRLSRRTLLPGTAGAVAAGGVWIAAPGAPNRFPFLTAAHLADLRTRFGRETSGARPRVLFVGNSFTLRHDVPGRVMALAETEGRPIATATAAAHGNRLVQTATIDALRALISDIGWEVVVLQDFSRTVLRSWDRWRSARAVADLAALAAPARVVLFPHMPRAPGHPLYAGQVGWFERVPDGIAEFTALNEDFYGGVARETGATLAPLGPAWRSAVGSGTPVYAPDGHHANARGAALIARVLWAAIAALLPRGGA